MRHLRGSFERVASLATGQAAVQGSEPGRAFGRAPASGGRRGLRRCFPGSPAGDSGCFPAGAAAVDGCFPAPAPTPPMASRSVS
jgi:hypothetical protein